jgi:hypothetical protein
LHIVRRNTKQQYKSSVAAGSANIATDRRAFVENCRRKCGPISPRCSTHLSCINDRPGINQISLDRLGKPGVAKY